MGQLGTALVAILFGVGGVVALFWLLNQVVERLPERWEHRLKPVVFVGPALLVVTAFLVVPALISFRLSFYGPSSQEFVGLDNYAYLTSQAARSAIWNTVLWIVLVPAVAVAVGLAVAVLADKLKARWEATAKSLIFLPMAISFVGASTIWLFVYAWRAEGQAQIGILNAIWTAMGGEPIAWLAQPAYNDFFLIFIMIWLQSGFAMVLLSAAIKSVPEETVEAARIDGAREVQIFWRVVVPQIRSTIMVVATTILILVLKIFDIVYVMTGGRAGTDVIANLYITEFINFFNRGHAAVLVVLLVVVTSPFMVINVRRFREQEAMR